MATVTIAREGQVGLPKEILKESHIKPGAELAVLTEAGKVVLLDRRQFRKRIAAVGDGMVKQLRAWMKANPEAPFFGGLTVKEYLELSEKQDQELWDRASAEAEQELRHARELDVPAHFVSAGQRRAARGAARRRTSR